MSVITIDLKLDSAKKQSEFLFKQKLSWQEEVDTLLDRMNDLNGFLSDMQKMLISLNFELERDFKAFKDSEKAPDLLKNITTLVAKMLRMVRSSDLYPGVKTTFGILKEENNYLREMLSDRNISIELEADPEMQKIITDTVKASK
jgi:hypothetical protein